ncbi:S-adenosyl-L-methionine-dependent methyltransferase [Lasiosphaeris hirsuta]|uniref:S-adenosyl-L-methionine-dependent methyltransferase n=1 Tax=Lasiosphaeris hirsuta TaxID=260670 RepID=A0AA40E1L7_9PEZI|nr:S-adenosyl-L-methionine-dependent methyltransferase [Lasiosphaeris hirsuta]
MATGPAADGPADPTYRSYTPSQAATYAQHRPSPPPALVKLILDHHATTGGQTGVLLDVGCGPGLATRAFSKHFDVAVGSDAGDSMIQIATELGGQTARGEPIRWVAYSAEEINKVPGVEKGSVDLVTAAYAAHWFDMPKFWAAAAEIMKPGGTVALWTGFRKVVESTTTQESKVRALFSRFHEEVLDAYSVPNTKISRDGYKDLVMPWDNAATVGLFDRDTFLRRELDRAELAPGDTAKAVAADPLAAPVWQRVENFLNTMDAVTRWREAHPDLAGTERDCVRVLVTDTMEAVADGQAKIEFRNLLLGMKTVLLCVKRVAE